MRNCLLLLTINFVFTLGCTDDEPSEEPIVLPGWGESSFYLNGMLEDEGMPELRRNNGTQDLYNFDIRKYVKSNEEYFQRSEFSVNALTYAQIVGQEKILLSATDFDMLFDTTNATVYFFRSHGDVVTGAYTVIENDTIEDYIQFNEIDSMTKEVSGIFQGSFAVPEGINPSLSGYGDTVILRNGYFHTKLVE
jgi:hypothetical protein